MISFKSKGSFNNTFDFFKRNQNSINLSILEECGRRGVEALSSATPKNSGDTANSWSYKINQRKSGVSISFENLNINQGVSIAIILQYGHGTKNGGWVEGVDYINPSIQPVMNELADKVWREVSK